MTPELLWGFTSLLGAVVGGGGVALFLVKTWRARREARLEARRAAYVDLVGELAIRGEVAPRVFRMRGADPVFRQVLLEYLRFLEGEERERLLQAARRLGVVEHYLRELRHSRRDVRATAVEALTELSDPVTVEDLLFALGDPVAEVRAQAAAGLAQLGDPRAVRSLVGALDREEEWNSGRIADALVSFGGSAVEELSRYLERPGRYRSLVARVLGLIGDPRAESALLRVLEVPEVELRVRAAAALGRIGAPRSGPALQEALRDPEWEVRAQAATALGKLMDPRAVPWLREALKDSSWWVRHNAAAALVEVPGGLEALRAALDDPDPFARDTAAAILLASGAARETVEELDSDDPLERQRAHELMRKLEEAGKAEYFRSLGVEVPPSAGPQEEETGSERVSLAVQSPVALEVSAPGAAFPAELLAELDRSETVDEETWVEELTQWGPEAVADFCRYLLISGPFLEGAGPHLHLVARALRRLAADPSVAEKVRRALAGRTELLEACGLGQGGTG